MELRCEYPAIISTPSILSIGRNTYTPITHDVTLETKLFFENAVQCLGIFTGIRAIDSIVRTHHRSDTTSDCISKWPGVKLVYSAIIDV